MLLKELERIRRRGYAIDNMEHEYGVRCIGAPIRNFKGDVFASISVSGPSQRLHDDRISEIALRIMESADVLSKQLGYVPEKITV